MWGAYVHMYTKYEISMFKSVARRGVQTMTPIMTHNRQSMIVQSSLVAKPNGPKTKSQNN